MFMPIALRPGARSKALCHNLIGSRKRPRKQVTRQNECTQVNGNVD